MAGKRGLPPTFEIDIPDNHGGPVKLGDYLDEVESAPPAPRPTPPRRVEEPKVIEMPRPAAPAREEVQPSESTGAEEVSPKRRKKRRKGPARKQINASPEALRMIEELIDHVQTYSVQKDAKASEVFHGLVLALYEAREFLELGEVEGRGRWGSPTAKAFPVNLKNAFQEAIATAYKKNHRR